MGKRKITIEKLENPNKRQVTFSKRRKGLFQKAVDACILCEAQIAIIVFSPAGRPYTFGHPSVDFVIDRYLTTKTNSNAVFANDEQRDLLLGKLEELEWERKKEKEWRRQKLQQGEDRHGFWWESIDIEDCYCLEKLQALKNGLENLKANVKRRVEEFLASSSRSGYISNTTDHHRMASVMGRSENKNEPNPLFLSGSSSNANVMKAEEFLASSVMGRENNIQSNSLILYGSSSDATFDYEKYVSFLDAGDDIEAPLILLASNALTTQDYDFNGFDQSVPATGFAAFDDNPEITPFSIASNEVVNNVAKGRKCEEDYSWPSENEWAELIEDDDFYFLPPL